MIHSIDRDERELKNIFIHYKKIHKLDTILHIGKKWYTCFDEADNSINVANLSLFGNNTDKERIRELLHEIGHSLDFKYNKKQMKKEREEVMKSEFNKMRYTTDIYYHDNLPFEKRAIDFAKKELHKWVGDDYDER